ncbi:MAG: hypothetical protein FVQ83_13490 [Chloroflexi bacterium]|nr:hypothetical protein [Chloroflexota bacterium]
MTETLNFIKTYEAAMYFVLGLGGIIYGWRFWEAWQHLRESVFGLERDNAQRRLNKTALSLFVLLTMSIFVYSVVTFVVPLLPVEELDLPSTVEILPDALSGGIFNEVTETFEELLITATPLPTVAVNPNDCDPESVNITSPDFGETISGEVEVIGTADIENFGHFKIEFAPADAEMWLPIVVGRSPVSESFLVEVWDTSNLEAGEYVLQLVVVDNSVEEELQCRIPVRISPTVE